MKHFGEVTYKLTTKAVLEAMVEVISMTICIQTPSMHIQVVYAYYSATSRDREFTVFLSFK